MSGEALLALVYVFVAFAASLALALTFRTFVTRRRQLPRGTRLAGAATFEYFQNRDVQRALEEIRYTSESWTETEEEGDDVSAHRTRGSRPPARGAPATRDGGGT